MVTPFTVFLIALTILALVITLGLLVYRKRWWAFIFMANILIAFIIIVYYMAPESDPVAIAQVDADTKLLIPIYILLLSISILFVIIAMACGAVNPTTDITNMGIGKVASTGILVFALFVVAAMPPIYVWYRVCIMVASVFILGILMLSTLAALVSYAVTLRVMPTRYYGCQTLSHILYYLSILGLISAASNCQSTSDMFQLIVGSVLATTTATVGILVESNAWQNPS